MTKSERSSNVLIAELAGQAIGDGLVVLPGQGNSLAIEKPTTLHPASPDAAAAVRSAISNPRAVLERARELADAGDTQLALHVIDLALDAGEDPDVVEARALKAELCRSRTGEVEPFVSKSCYQSSARLLGDGHTSWTTLT